MHSGVSKRKCASETEDWSRWRDEAEMPREQGPQAPRSQKEQLQCLLECCSLEAQRFFVPCRVPWGPLPPLITFLSLGQPEWISVPYKSEGLDESTKEGYTADISTCYFQMLVLISSQKFITISNFSTSNLYMFYFFRLTE